MSDKGNSKTEAKKSKIGLSGKIAIALWVLFVLGVIGVITLFSMINNGSIGHMPKIEELTNPKNKFATEIYSCDGQVLGRYFQSSQNRVYTGYEELSPYLIKALIATEDVRYREHSGIDFKSLFRAIFKSVILQQKSSGGGSTISQQLAKLLYTDVAKTKFERAMQKPTEWVIATKLEKFYTKEEIMTMYLNEFDFLNNAVGIRSAAQVYFSSTPDQLKMEEAALLVGMLKNPAQFNPHRESRYDACLGRRNVVFDQMTKAGYLTKSECDSLKQLPITLHFNKVDHKEGLAPYFREYLRKVMTAEKPNKKDYPKWNRQKYYEDSLAWEVDPLFGWCNKNTKPDGTPYNLYTDGLKIRTTVDSRMQKYAEEAVREYLGGHIQTLFFKEKEGRKRAPFSNKTSQAQVDSMMNKAMRLTERYQRMKGAGCSADSIRKAFNTKVSMKVFDWANGTKDTVMTPLDSLKYIKHFIRSGMMSIDPKNGHVKAYVGGPDFRFFQYDMCTAGRRQVGSTIKPFLYAYAMEQGMNPCDMVANTQPSVKVQTGRGENDYVIWQPKNVPYGEEGKKEIGQMITLKRGLQTSNNWTSARIMMQYHPEGFVKLLHSFGIKNQEIEPVYSLCLGVCDLTIAEMCGAYTAFANHGIQIEPLYVEQIEDNNGNIISTFSPRMNEILSEETTEKMISLMQGVINGGTGLRIRSSSFSFTCPWEPGTPKHYYKIGWETQMAGKTGTTQNNSDGWFMGYTPDLVTGVWVGGEDRDIHFDNLRNGQGSSTALPIWGVYMNKVFNDASLHYDRTAKFNVKETYDCAGSTKGNTENVEDVVEGVWE